MTEQAWITVIVALIGSVSTLLAVFVGQYISNRSRSDERNRIESERQERILRALQAEIVLAAGINETNKTATESDDEHVIPVTYPTNAAAAATFSVDRIDAESQFHQAVDFYYRKALELNQIVTSIVQARSNPDSAAIRNLSRSRVFLKDQVNDEMPKIITSLKAETETQLKSVRWSKE